MISGSGRNPQKSPATLSPESPGAPPSLGRSSWFTIQDHKGCIKGYLLGVSWSMSFQVEGFRFMGGVLFTTQIWI